METLLINVPDKKIDLVKTLLKELGVNISEVSNTTVKEKNPNKLTAKTISDAHKGIGLAGPIQNIDGFINSL